MGIFHSILQYISVQPHVLQKNDNKVSATKCKKWCKDKRNIESSTKIMVESYHDMKHPYNHISHLKIKEKFV